MTISKFKKPNFKQPVYSEKKSTVPKIVSIYKAFKVCIRNFNLAA